VTSRRPSPRITETSASLGNTATCLKIPEGTSSTTMKHGLLRGAAEINIPVTVRKISGGLLF
jgi:hypothetical protein